MIHPFVVIRIRASFVGQAKGGTHGAETRDDARRDDVARCVRGRVRLVARRGWRMRRDSRAGF
jgi:hypothetical protein